MNNIIQDGDVIQLAAPAAVTSGQLVQIGALVGVAVASAPSGAQFGLRRTGQFTVPKTAGSGTALTLGGLVYIASGATAVTGVASGNRLIGVATAAAADGATSATIVLTGQVA